MTRQITGNELYTALAEFFMNEPEIVRDDPFSLAEELYDHLRYRDWQVIGPDQNV